MNAHSPERLKITETHKRMALFPAFVLALYGILFAVTPDKVLVALKSSGNILLSIIQPLALVFVVMVALNIVVKPTQIAGFFKKGFGIKGIMLSAATGIISAGPIYAWYPLLKKLRKDGVGSAPIAIFLYNRAVKPFLLPVMIAYFGWKYAVILTVLTVLGSIALGYSLSLLMKEEDRPSV